MIAGLIPGRFEAASDNRKKPPATSSADVVLVGERNRAHEADNALGICFQLLVVGC